MLQLILKYGSLLSSFRVEVVVEVKVEMGHSGR